LPICVRVCKDCKVLVLKIVGSDKFLSFLLLGWWAMFCSGSKELLHHSIPTHRAHILVNRLQHLHLPPVLCMPNRKLTHNKLTPNKHMHSSRYIYKEKAFTFSHEISHFPESSDFRSQSFQKNLF
jgi:hypothetical protein